LYFSHSICPPLRIGRTTLTRNCPRFLAYTKAHTEALEELKSMFAKYIGRFRESDEGSPSVTKSALENQVSQPSPLIQPVEVQNVNTSDQEECQVDSGGQQTGVTVKGNNVNDNKANKVENWQAEVLEVPSAAEKAAEDHVQVASAVRKGNVNAVPSTTPQAHVTNTSSKLVQKQGAKGSAPEKQSPRRPKPPLEKTTEPKALDTEVKGGAPTGSSKTEVVGAPTKEKDLYSLEGAIDGLLEVGASVGPRSPPKVKKSAKSAEGEAIATPINKAPNKVRTKNEKVSNTVPSPEGKKLLVLNVHGTLLDCSLLLDKNPNPGICPILRTAKRQVIFRPGLTDFLNKCFLHFEVAF
jgi:hypothetical protein